MGDYLWFHAFRRDRAREIVQVLTQGPLPHPDPECATQRHERELGIPAPCVYAYLGQTVEAFGDAAFALPFDAVVGRVSPFDTGGLVHQIGPVKAWKDTDRRRFLKRYSWSSSRMPTLVDQYPTPSRKAQYLAGQRPAVAGPHDVWPAKAHPYVAAIWTANDDRRAWLWECRSPENLQTGASRLVSWTCSPATYPGIVEYCDQHARGEEADSLASLLSTYVKGGVGTLVAQLRPAQEDRP